MERYENWRIGHFRRKIPAGYLQSLGAADVAFEDKDLEEYYKKLLILIRDPVFRFERIKENFYFNIGRYDSLIDVDKYR